MHNKQKKLSDAIKYIIDIKGIGAFENSSIFCAMIDDIVPYLDKERKIIHRVLNNDILRLLSNAYLASAHYRKIILSKVEIELKENMELSDEWCKIILDNFSKAFEDEIANSCNYVNIEEMRGHCEKVKKRFAVGKFAIMALKTDGTVTLTALRKKLDYDIATWKGERISSVVGSIYDFAALTEKGTVLVVGENRRGQCDVADWNNIVDIIAGVTRVFGIMEEGRIVAAGQINEWYIYKILEWKGIVTIVQGQGYIAALRCDGRVLISFDKNSVEQYQHLKKIKVDNWENIVALFSTRIGLIGIKSDGTAMHTEFDYGENKWLKELHLFHDVKSIDEECKKEMLFYESIE